MFPLLLLAALPALTGVAEGEVVAVGARGAGPMFVAPASHEVVAPRDSDVTLNCTVLNLADKALSWVRSSDLQILSHGGIVFTADARVSLTASDTLHSLHIARLRPSDTGQYECQLNTDPKMSLFFNLSVVDEPVPHVVVEGADARGRRGGYATLKCTARYEPEPFQLTLPPPEVRWFRHSHPLNLLSSRGGATLVTERWPARVESYLTLAELREEDEGVYTCAVDETFALIHLTLQPEVYQAEVMQRDEASVKVASRAARLHTRVTLAVLLLLLLALR